MTARQNWLRRSIAMMMAVVMVLTTNISTVFASEKQSTREIPETKPTAEIPENIADGTYEVPVGRICLAVVWICHVIYFFGMVKTEEGIAND